MLRHLELKLKLVVGQIFILLQVTDSQTCAALFCVQQVVEIGIGMLSG